ncbi:MAG TPA: acetoacetate decarboxylase family protein [Candidatus Binatia bacterium]
MKATTKRRGGKINLRGTEPRGLPLLKPLYGPGPYQYRNDRCLLVIYESDENAVREVLPRELEPLEGNVVVMCFFECPDVSGIGPHNFAMPCIPVRYGDYTGQFVPYLYTSTDASLACYREVQGWPAVLGETMLTAARNQICASVVRDGRQIMVATAEVGGDAVTSLDFLPIILYKEIPSLDGSRREVAYLETSTSRLEHLNFLSGSAALSFPDPDDDPIARLRPVQVQQALYGTLDDFYPETIRILHQY